MGGCWGTFEDRGLGEWEPLLGCVKPCMWHGVHGVLDCWPPRWSGGAWTRGLHSQVPRSVAAQEKGVDLVL